MTLQGPAIGAEMEIRQNRYLYQMPFTQNVSQETFVISSGVKLAKSPKSAQQINASEAILLSAHFTNPIVVHFAINSSEIQPGEAERMLTELRDLKVSGPLILEVTGFTCQKGSDRFNNWLSAERAKVVAELLKKEGFSVSKIVGRGSADLVNEDDFPINRRVEVTMQKR